MTFTIRPAASGGWLAFASGSLLLAVPDGSTPVSDGWAAAGSGLQAVLDALTGQGLAATPSFVLVDWQPGGAARVLVRGELELTVVDASGTQQLSGTGVSTWVERSMPGVTALSFAVPGSTAASQTELPLAAGVALVAAIASEGAPAVPPVESAPLASAPPVEPTPVVALPPAVDPAPPVDPLPPVERVETPDAAPVVDDIGLTRREAPPTEAEPAATDDDGGYDYLFGDTMYRGVVDAAVHEPEEAEAAPVDDELHDGETVMVDSIKKLRGKRRPAASAIDKPEASAPLVLVMPNGTREPLSQPILIGRAPTVGKVSGAIPRPLTLGTGDQDISRNHAQFALEGGTVVVTDLHSRNGTSIILPGKTPQKLRAGEPTSIIVGTVVDFGGGLVITVDDKS